MALCIIWYTPDSSNMEISHSLKEDKYIPSLLFLPHLHHCFPVPSSIPSLFPFSLYINL